MDTNNGKLIQLLQQKISYIEELQKKVDYEALRQWREETLMVLDRLITPESKYYSNFEDLSFRSGVVSYDENQNRAYDEERYHDGLTKAKSSLSAVIFGLNNSLLV